MPAATLAPKSATSPIAMALGQANGGIVSLTAVLTGVLGAMAGRGVLDRLNVWDLLVRGPAMGVSAHGVGTSRVLAESPTAGAFSALAMACSGLLTVPLTLRVFGMRGREWASDVRGSAMIGAWQAKER